ncbi:MAG TPA: hypothetical protein VK608_13030 [Edaphobacter sp.]|nr:hypothetical protein [Edaphobacter sp.]
MRSLRLRALIFCALLVPFVASLRFLLTTRFGILAAAIAIVIGTLWLLYRSMKTMALAVWEVSGIVAQMIEDANRRRSAMKESSHATRLL